MVLFHFHEDKLVPSVISAKTLWRLVGSFAFLMPILVFLANLLPGGCRAVQDSISAYYYTNARNVFVGVLCAVSLFLFAYNGYETIDAVVSKFASVFAAGIAFFPTTYDGDIPPCFFEPINTNAVIGTVHYLSATFFFLLISFMSLFLFTRTHEGRKEADATRGKRGRNFIYRLCGIVMLLCLALIAVYNFWVRKYTFIPSLTFYLESIVLFAFGVSWLVKGRTIKAVARMIGLGSGKKDSED